MRFIPLLIGFLLSVGTSASARQDTSKFRQRPTPIELNDGSYDSITSTRRDYHVAILLTAIDARYGCSQCRSFQSEWDLIAHSWNKGIKPDGIKLAFGTLDFSNGRNTFQKLMVHTAPTLFLFPPTVGPFATGDATPAKHDLSGPMSAEQCYAWINRHLPEGHKPPIVRPINYLRLISAITILMGLVALVSVVGPYALPIIRNRNLWAAASLIFILLFTSGHMFNHIRKVPYVTSDGKGGITYFAGGFSNQLGMETQIIAAIYGTLSFAIIVLALKVPRIVDARAQQLAVIVWGTILLGMYSFLLSVFRVKNGGYPFFLPPF